MPCTPQLEAVAQPLARMLGRAACSRPCDAGPAAQPPVAWPAIRVAGRAGQSLLQAWCRRLPPDPSAALLRPRSLLADRTHVLDLASAATVADVKAAIEVRQGEAVLCVPLPYFPHPLLRARQPAACVFVPAAWLPGVPRSARPQWFRWPAGWRQSYIRAVPVATCRHPR